MKKDTARGRRRALGRLFGLGTLVSVAAAGALAAQSAAPAVESAPANAPPPRPGDKLRLLIVGDSLSAEYGLRRGAGWPTLLQQRLRAQRLDWEVVNASISGETTSGGATRLPALLARHQPRAVVIELGGNDALRGLPLQGTRDNLQRMARLAREAGAQVLIAGMKIPPNYGRDYSERFERMYAEVARSERAVLVPFLLEGLVDREELFQQDRIHPTEAAQPIMLDNVWPVLLRLLNSAEIRRS